MIYVACPARLATGGTELIHQFVMKLGLIGVSAKVYYHNAKGSDPVAPRFSSYHAPYIVNVSEIGSRDIFVVPETMTALFSKVRATKVVWWLSVDNFKAVNPGGWWWGIRERLKGRHVLDFGNESVSHYMQSEYARIFVESMGGKSRGYLSDYLSASFIEGGARVDCGVKKDQVVYNPSKGFEFTSALIEAAPDISFVPIRGMTPAQVADLLAESKVYIDFGTHPGKDRIPREAAIMGCCVIAGKRGAAGNPVDVPIPDAFKVDEDVALAADMVRRCFSDYENICAEYTAYRKKIQGEESVFDAQVRQFAKDFSLL